MGVDVYLRWNGQTADDKQAQFTGFSTCHGHVGYLREAYHGGPYATQILIPEGWAENDTSDADGAIRVPVATLRERLPETVLASLVRDLMLYQSGTDPADLGKIQENEAGEPDIAALGGIILARLKAARMQAKSWGDDVPDNVMAFAMAQAVLWARYGWLPAHAQAFVDFVELAAKMDTEGKDPRIVVSA